MMMLFIEHKKRTPLELSRDAGGSYVLPTAREMKPVPFLRRRDINSKVDLNSRQ